MVSLQTPGTLGLLGLYHNDVIFWELSFNGILLWGLSHNDGLLTRELLKGAKKAGVLGEAGLAERPAMCGGEPGAVDVLAVCVRVQRAITLEPVLTIQMIWIWFRAKNSSIHI